MRKDAVDDLLTEQQGQVGGANRGAKTGLGTLIHVCDPGRAGESGATCPKRLLHAGPTDQAGDGGGHRLSGPDYVLGVRDLGV